MLSISKIISSTIFTIVQKFFSFLSLSLLADAHARVEHRTCRNNFFYAACDIVARIVRLARQLRSRAFCMTISSGVIVVQTSFRLALSSTNFARPTNTTV
jgi:hypothetical protein